MAVLELKDRPGKPLFHIEHYIGKHKSNVVFFSGVYISLKYFIFARPPFLKNDIFPPSTVKSSPFPPIFNNETDPDQGSKKSAKIMENFNKNHYNNIHFFSKLLNYVYWHKYLLHK